MSDSKAVIAGVRSRLRISAPRKMSIVSFPGIVRFYHQRCDERQGKSTLEMSNCLDSEGARREVGTKGASSRHVVHG